ncbi:MAG: glycosyltransferase family 1 protein [bacterium]|nr:glycosyltransferase family 1 protein [bacterium]
MKIGLNLLFLIPNKVGGTETYARGILEQLDIIDKKNEYLVFCNQENYSSFRFKEKRLKKILCPIKAVFRPFRIIFEQFCLPVIIFLNHVDAIVSFGYIGPLFVPCKSHVVIYDLNWFYHPEEFSRFSHFFWKTLVTLSAKRAERIITSSQNSKQSLIEVLNILPEKIFVVYGGIDRTRFQPIIKNSEIVRTKKKYGLSGDFIFTASAAYKFKNLGRLIDAFKVVVGEIPDIQLLIVGLDGKAGPEILGKIKNGSLEKNVIIAGWVPNSDLPILYSSAKLYVHPSLYEGFGFPVLEAMACGTPVISSNAASLPELVGDGGILVDAKKTEKLAKEIIRVLKDKGLSSTLIKKGRVRASLFTWEKSAKIFHSLLTK